MATLTAEEKQGNASTDLVTHLNGRVEVCDTISTLSWITVLKSGSISSIHEVSAVVIRTEICNSVVTHDTRYGEQYVSVFDAATHTHTHTA